jgi:hypothetical protein
MELSKKQLDNLKKHVGKKSLREILLSQFPNIRISIIRGYDQFSYEEYTKGAYFSEKEAKNEMAKIPPNGYPTSFSDKYHIVTGTIRDLEEGKIKDGERFLDGIDGLMTYFHLEKNLGV